MKNIKILSKTETNSFADETKAHNGGGYKQPLVEFEINGKKGVFEDTSCGDFGSRFFLEVDGKTASWGTMLDDFETWSDFTGREDCFMDLSKKFGVPTEQDVTMGWD